MERLQGESSWLHALAKSELHADAERILQWGSSFDPQQLVEESTVVFLAELRDFFQEYVRSFNPHSENGARFQEVKVYTIAQTASDFMLFRNQIKLIFSNPAHGVIQIAYAQHVRNRLSVNGQEAVPELKSGQPQELTAQLGPFRDVFWSFQGEKVSAEQVAKFYFVEFVQITREHKKSKVGNQLLLDQIKALLQEKGLDL